MPSIDLYTHLAEIAGVFVGFGTLIAVRDRRPSDWQELVPMRNVVALGMLTVVAALTPVLVAQFDLAEHQIWVVSSVVVLVGMALLFVANSMTPEYRTYWGSAATLHRRWTDTFQGALTALYMAVVLAGLVVIVLGLAPHLDAALYCAVVVLMLVGAGWALLTLVFTQQAPQRHVRHHALV